MRRSFVNGLVAVLVLVLGAGQASAQETLTPNFKAPYRSFEEYEFGASLSFPENSDFGLEGFYTFGSRQNDFGLRGGFIRIAEDFTRYVIGGNFRTRVVTATESFPLDGALTVGAGAIFGDGDDFFDIPVGVSLGRRLTLEGSSTTFTPFAHPVLVPVFGGGDSDVNFALGLGVDINFSRNLSARVHGGIGDIEGIGLSLAFIH